MTTCADIIVFKCERSVVFQQDDFDQDAASSLAVCLCQILSDHFATSLFPQEVDEEYVLFKFNDANSCLICTLFMCIVLFLCVYAHAHVCVCVCVYLRVWLCVCQCVYVNVHIISKKKKRKILGGRSTGTWYLMCDI